MIFDIELGDNFRRKAIMVAFDHTTNTPSYVTYKSAPRYGNLQQILHIFAFLKKDPKLTLYFDPSTEVIDPTSFTGSTAE